MSSQTISVPDQALQQTAFQALADIFMKYEPQTPGSEDLPSSISIEILDSDSQVPPGQLILEDESERAVGVPKPVLIAAFLHARQLFKSTPISEREDPLIDAATKIILLYDPEYLTAANARKTYLLNMLGMKVAYGPMHSMLLTHAVRKELWFLESVLNSPLRRQSKSPTLWWQRAWLFRTFVFPAGEEGGCEILMSTKGDLMRELDVVLRSAEMHQHNYYAFGYARRILRPAMKIVEQRETNKADGSTGQNWKEILQNMVKWCKRHPSDTSGWSFLGYWMEWRIDDAVREKAVREVLNFAVEVRWKGEALWSFLRTIARLDETNAKGELVLRIREAMENLCPKLLRRPHSRPD